MTSKDRVQAALNHIEGDAIPVDFGATSVTGIHCKVVESLRRHYGLEDRPVHVIEPFQMLGLVDSELQQIMGIDCDSAFGLKDMFNIDQTKLHLQTTQWGQQVLIAQEIDLTPAGDGNTYIYAKGDRNYPPSGVMPQGCYFMNATERQEFVDDDTLKVEDNLEEFGYISDADLDYFTQTINQKHKDSRAIVASFGGTALGDIAFIPGMGLEDPKGIRNVSEWYMSTVMRQDFIHQVFDKQTDIAIENYKKLWAAVGDKVDVVFTCGTDFGTQESQFCSSDTFNQLWLPHYRRMNDWIHANTTWKVFKHSCGAMLPLLPNIIEAGFDIINPVQINAKGMDSRHLKEEFGRDLTFWGGGIDTQKILPSGTPDQIRRHVFEQCEIFGKGGGFVFNSVHNIQANVPTANIVAMIDALAEVRKQ